MKGVRRLGVRVGNWLTPEEGKKLLGTENAETLRSQRIVLCSRFLSGVAFGGLRRQPYGLKISSFGKAVGSSRT